jgi:hypothetical protein
VPRLLQRMIVEDDGVLSFEWVLMITVLVIGIVAGLAAARDAIIDELGDAATGIIALDQTYQIDNPFRFAIDNPLIGNDENMLGGSASSSFLDSAVAYDCTRGDNAPQGQESQVDEN